MATAAFQIVTPELARAWLSSNTDNRPIKATQVNRLAEDMRLGRWTLTPDAISFDINGTITNGQHRLAAIVQSGVTVTVMVARGLPLESFQSTDQGCSRSVADALREDKHLVALANFLVKFVWQRQSKPCNESIRLFCEELKPHYLKLMATVSVKCTGAASPRGYCRTQMIAAGLISLMETKSPFSSVSEEYVLRRFGAWFNGEEPTKLTVTVMSFLGEKKNRVDLYAAFLKFFHIFDPSSQDYVKLYCRNEANVRATIQELLTIPSRPLGDSGAGRIDHLTGESLKLRAKSKSKSEDAA